jgi:acetolactate synthase-1/3 small subunit
VVSAALDGNYSRITITAKGDPKVLEQIIKQCNKLIDILHAEEYDPKSSIEKELALIKIKVSAGAGRTEVLQICEHFKGITVDFTEDSLVIQVTGNTEKVDACILMLNKYNIQEVVRTGKVLVRRGLELT